MSSTWTSTRAFFKSRLGANWGIKAHAVVSASLVSFFVLLGVPWVLMVVVNPVFWIVREISQTSKPIAEWTRLHHLEWIVPVLTGTVAAYVTNLFI